MQKKEKIFFFLLAFLFGFFFFFNNAFAADLVIETWSSPTNSLYLNSTNHVLFSGTWSLPKDYYGVIQFKVDGKTAGTQIIESFGFAGAKKTDDFSFDAGSFTTNTWNAPNRDQDNGGHEASITVLFEPRCLRDGTCQLCLNNIPNNPSGCKLRSVQVYSPRDYYINGVPGPLLYVSGKNRFIAAEGSSQTQSYWVQNNGSITLLGKVNIIGGDGTLSCLSNCSYSVPPGGGTSVPIRFRAPPDSAGTTYTADIVFSCDNCSPAVNYTISAISVSISPTEAPKIAVSQWNNSPLADPVYFGSVKIGLSKRVTMQVENIGGTVGGGLSGDLRWSPDSGQYHCTYTSGTCNTTVDCSYSKLPSGGVCQMEVQFIPTVEGDDKPTATFTNTTNPSDSKLYLFNGRGLSSTPDMFISMETGQSNFGKIIPGTSKELSFRFSNNGTGTVGPGKLLIGSPFYCVSTTNPSGVVDPNCGYSLAKDSYFDAVVRFSPMTTGEFSDDLEFSVPADLIKFPLYGTGAKKRYIFTPF